MDNVGFVVAGYALAAAAIGGYVANLFSRARRARRGADALSAPTPNRP
ncbi:MAG TPA: hypothetical protein VKA30_09170 [Actinomycetota bacterium]|nr:hypothetical protein [Actinomycetota bacterium]